jgi:hypothetical protein
LGVSIREQLKASFQVGDFEVRILSNRDGIVLQIFVEVCNPSYATTFMFALLHFIHLSSWYNIMMKCYKLKLGFSISVLCCE